MRQIRINRSEVHTSQVNHINPIILRTMCLYTNMRYIKILIPIGLSNCLECMNKIYKLGIKYAITFQESIDLP
jgi:hypothetical protein